MSTRRRWGIALPAIAVLLAVVACAAQPAHDRTVEPAATPVAERTSGPLASGVEIVEGSALLGTVFHVSGGWTAVLRIDGAPSPVVEAYRAQLEAALHAPIRPAPATCGADLTQPPFDLLCRSGGATGPYYARLRALLSDDDDRDYLVLEWLNLAAVPQVTDTPPPLGGGPVASATDEELAPSYTPDDDGILRVVEGSRLLGDPLPSESSGYQAVLQVTGDPAAVVRGYAAQFHRGAVSVSADGGPIIATWDQAGGAHVVVRTDGDGAFILVEYSYD